MRIILKKGKQRELINLVKMKNTWDELSNKLSYSSGYIRNELRNEKTYLSDSTYRKLCGLTNVNFDKFIIKTLEDSWGQIKGAKFSSGNLKKLIEPKDSGDLAELFGIILGDGHIDKIKRGKKLRCYCVTIAGDSVKDKDYLEKYVSSLFNRLFGEKGHITPSKTSQSIFLKLHGKRIVEFINKKGIKSGNKKMNLQSIPEWILKNPEYLKSCLRGLIDTDGSVHYISRNNRNIRITFVSHIPPLLQRVRSSFIKLGFNPSKIVRERQIFLSSKKDIFHYLKNIGFKNTKHLKRFENLRKHAPVV